jgi:hypothetical protein
VDDYVVNRVAMRVASLNSSRASLPYLDRAILRTCDHPFALTMKRDACDVSGVTFKCEERIRVRGLDIVELDSVMTCGS